MVKITYTETKDTYAIKSEGHACYAEIGKDIVCAAVTVLLVTLSDYLAANTYSFRIIENRVEEGQASIEVKVTDKNNMIVRNLFYMTVSGLEAIANTYPDHVRIYEKIEK